MAVVSIAAILMTMAVPQIGKNAETVRVDKAGSELRSLWRAQRRHKLERGVYADSLQVLEAGGYVDGHYAAASDPFVYKILVGSQSRLQLEASRANGSRWFGKLMLDEQGDLTGQLTSKDGEVILP
jgi:competence protein ComGC